MAVWGPIIAIILQSVLPMLEQLLISWLNGALNKKAASLTPLSVPSTGLVGATDPALVKQDKLTLLHAVRGDLYFFQFAKKRAVDAAIAAVK